MSLFLNQGAPTRRTLRERWTALWETEPPVYPLRLGPVPNWPRTRRFSSAFLVSTFVHCAVVFFYYSIPFALLLALFGMHPPRVSAPAAVIVERFEHITLPNYLPTIGPHDSGKAPGQGARRRVQPKLGASHFDPRITIISSPPKPDNFRLTLENLSAPPDLRPPKDLKIPDFISGGPASLPAPPKASPPAPPKVESPAPPKPVEAAAPPPPPEPPKSVVPKLPAFPVSPPPPVQLAMNLPNIPAPRLEVPLPPPPAQTPKPAAPAPETPAAASVPGKNAKPVAEAKTGTEQPSEAASRTAPGGSAQKPGGGPRITSLSVEPAPFKDISSVPGGVHQGAFSISPEGSAGGSPAGVRGGATDAGEGGHGPGGNKSLAPGSGNGKPGGSGEEGATNTSLSVSGGATGGAGGSGTLPPLKAADLVFPVKPETPKAHAPGIVISSGSGGGGGLRMFGVLHSGRIYTVYFSMPVKSWVLQYCAHTSPAQVDARATVVQIHIDPPLVPPAAIEQYDFHRPPAPDPANPSYILHGIVRADGSVGNLEVLHGLDPLSDEAAKDAFARWKFKPATANGTPVEIEVLVGIP